MVERTLQTLDTMVGFDTVSSKSNLALIDWAADLLEASGARLRRTFDDTGEKANLLASFGPAAPGGIVLSGHTDVVPVANQNWSTDPFTLTRKGERVQARGTTDMKGFCAAAIAAVTAADLSGLKRPIHVALSYDEEVGCLGVPRLVDDLVANEPLPAVAIVGEPTEMRIVTAHKSANVFETVFEGFAAHSSQSHIGVSATVALARFIEHLRVQFAAFKANPDPSSALEPPYPTFNAGVVTGGTALNIIPSEARMIWEFRTMPDQDPQAMLQDFLAVVDAEIVPEMSNEHATLASRTQCLAMVPALDPANNRSARKAVMALGDYDGDDAVSFGTEAGSFQGAGIETVVCGPGSITIAHQPDESIAIDQLAAATRLVDDVIAAAKA
ncbi:MAG: acetylornithine deacetylase [Pseudomonadota bacterium]